MVENGREPAFGTDMSLRLRSARSQNFNAKQRRYERLDLLCFCQILISPVEVGWLVGLGWTKI